MASALNLLDRFYLEIDDVEHKKVPLELGIAWLNEAQLAYVDGTEMIQDTWSPSLSSSISLPTNFLRELVVKPPADTTVPMEEMDYHKAIFEPTFQDAESRETHYSIFAGTFYIWPTQSGSITLTVLYLKKPADVTSSNYTTADLEIPKEFHQHLLPRMLARFFAKRDQEGDRDREVRWNLEFEQLMISDRGKFNTRRYAPAEIEVEKFYQNM